MARAWWRVSLVSAVAVFASADQDTGVLGSVRRRRCRFVVRRAGVGGGSGGGAGFFSAGGFGLGVEPLVEGDGEGEELLLVVEGVDLFKVELGVVEGWVVELADVVEEVAGECWRAG